MVDTNGFHSSINGVGGEVPHSLCQSIKDWFYLYLLKYLEDPFPNKKPLRWEKVQTHHLTTRYFFSPGSERERISIAREQNLGFLILYNLA